MSAENGRNIGGLQVDIHLATGEKKKRSTNRNNDRNYGRDKNRNDYKPRDNYNDGRRDDYMDRRSNDSSQSSYNRSQPVQCQIFFLGHSAKDHGYRTEREIREVVDIRTDTVESSPDVVNNEISKCERQGIPYVLVSKLDPRTHSNSLDMYSLNFLTRMYQSFFNVSVSEVIKLIEDQIGLYKIMLAQLNPPVHTPTTSYPSVPQSDTNETMSKLLESLMPRAETNPTVPKPANDLELLNLLKNAQKENTDIVPNISKPIQPIGVVGSHLPYNPEPSTPAKLNGPTSGNYGTLNTPAMNYNSLQIPNSAPTSNPISPNALNMSYNRTDQQGGGNMYGYSINSSQL
eukprot:TRINITY_DN1992_c0_g2_i1.p1 TRINITY_DN1992_c0_g2~~TRINITY_DN1992_c0_g2_i1.p1  ORF type:complete len:403 (+),score=77.64 TRINITY_DN1992_c0_g2_i1:176-1210(+)